MASTENNQDRVLIHSAYFKLHDNSKEAQEKLMGACREYLTGHPGVLYFSVATLSDIDRPVSDREYDVALHMQFDNRAAHDAYQVSERHVAFVKENSPNFKVARIFDSEVQFDG